MRIGHGIDAHRLVPGRPLMLGCLRVPGDRGLLGHSDGDAAAHALAAALLGAAGIGDLGEHFPPDDAAWRDAPGALILQMAAGRTARAGFALQSAQVVVIAERPRLAPHLEGMAAAMAIALTAPAGTVTVAATSTDGLGFAGRGEGIAASAVVLLSALS